jgi:hypothetical protein
MHSARSTKRAAIAAAMVPFLVTFAGCDDAASSTTAPAAPANPDVVVNGEDGGGERVPFDVAEVFFEFNTTDNDLGFQVFVDAEGWNRMTLAGPSRRHLVDVMPRGPLADLGITELRFESAEPSPAEVLALFPPGPYTFTGRTVEGERLMSTDALSHDFLAPPALSPSGGQVVDPGATVVSWNAPGAERVEIIIEQEDLGHILDIIVSGSISSLDVPPQFLLPGTEYKIEILAIAENGNRTIVESTFVTAFPGLP